MFPNNDSIKTGLQNLTAAYLFRLCGAEADHFGHHPLICHNSKGRIPKHVTSNKIIQNTATLHISSKLEPSSRSDGRKADAL